MNIIFAGPTISHTQIKRFPDCICLPPVKHGDILRCLKQMPVALGIIDGYFEGAPSVWHKEILYALDQGVHVYGGSSMGALRAAELHPFGMQGVGKVFEWYRDGVITDDDEVAVLHGPEEAGFMMASEPMVNIRATLDLAREHEVINEGQKKALVDAAKSTFYKHRSWTSLLETSHELFDDETLNAVLEDWLSGNRVDIKKIDAIQLLTTMHQSSAEHEIKHQPNFHFEWTNVWDKAFHQHENWQSDATSLLDNHQQVVDQLRLDPDRFERYRDKALLSLLARNSIPIELQENDLKSALAQFRIDNGLGLRSQLLDYMSDADLNESQLTELLKNASRVRLCLQAAGDLQASIVEQLKLDGNYLTLLNVVKLKQEFMQSAVFNPDDPEILPPQMLAWYFGDRLGTSIPKRLEDHLSNIELDNAKDFYRLITIDYLYSDQQG